MTSNWEEKLHPPNSGKKDYHKFGLHHFSICQLYHTKKKGEEG